MSLYSNQPITRSWQAWNWEFCLFLSWRLYSLECARVHAQNVRRLFSDKKTRSCKQRLTEMDRFHDCLLPPPPHLKCNGLVMWQLFRIVLESIGDFRVFPAANFPTNWSRNDWLKSPQSSQPFAKFQIILKYNMSAKPCYWFNEEVVNQIWYRNIQFFFHISRQNSDLTGSGYFYTVLQKLPQTHRNFRHIWINHSGLLVTHFPRWLHIKLLLGSIIATAFLLCC